MCLLASTFTAIQNIHMKTPTSLPAHPSICTLLAKGKLKLKTHFEPPTFSQLSEWRSWLLGGTSQCQGWVKWHCAGRQVSVAEPRSPELA